MEGESFAWVRLEKIGELGREVVLYETGERSDESKYLT